MVAPEYVIRKCYSEAELWVLVQTVTDNLWSSLAPALSEWEREILKDILVDLRAVLYHSLKHADWLEANVMIQFCFGHVLG